MSTAVARQTPPQTVGPFFHPALLQLGVDDLDPGLRAGQPIRTSGRVVDGDGAPVGDAMVEIWQADGGGRYRHPADGRSSGASASFVGFGRVATGTDGSFGFDTVMPGTVPARAGAVQAPHINVQVFARGLLSHLCTRIYFDGHPDNGSDPVLSGIPPARRSTLLATPAGDDAGRRHYMFDIVLQGDDETVFFDV